MFIKYLIFLVFELKCGQSSKGISDCEQPF